MNTSRAVRVALLTLCAFAGGCGGEGGSAPPDFTPVAGSPVQLRVELLRGNEVAIDTATPRFSWALSGNDVQSGFRVLVGSMDPRTPAEADFWDSGQVRSSRSLGIHYAGKPLQASRRYYWRVQVWSESGQPGQWSAPQAFTVGDLASHLPPRLPLVTRSVAPSSVIEVSPGHVFIAFPQAAYGTLVLDFPGPGNAADFDVTIGEHRVGNAVWRSAEDGFTPEISIATHAGRIHWNGSAGQRRLDLPLRHVEGSLPLPDGLPGILPFRYAEVSGPASDLRDVKYLQLAVNYPFDDGAATFSSSDTVLNDIWEMSHYTMKATSAFGLFIDGNRERLPYEADAYINQLGHYSAVADYSLARFTNAYLLRVPSWPTEWVLHNHLMAWADYEYTGDDSYLRDSYEYLQRFLLLPLARADGLISTRTGLVTPQYMASLGMTLGPEDIVDWPAIERDGYDMGVTYNTVVNLFHYRALTIMASIATVLGRGDDAAFYETRARLVRSSILGAFFDSQRGVFVDGEGSTHASLHANMFALAFDVLPGDARASVVEFVKGKGMATSVYGAQYLLEGLYANREGEASLKLLTSRGTRSWAHMVHDLGATIAHEAWDPLYKPNEDWNHAWGAAPANLIPRWLMGIRPLEPGFATFLVAPQIGSLTWAQIRVPSPRGTIQVQVANEAAEDVSIQLLVPPNASALVEPGCRSENAAILVDGRLVSSSAGPGSQTGPLGPGTHEIACRPR